MKLRIGAIEEAGWDDGLLIEGNAEMPGGVPFARFALADALAEGTPHAIGCACCLPRGPVAEALTKLFFQCVRGEVRYFSAVVAVPATPAGEAAIRAALQADPLVSARFRLSE